MKMKKSKGIVSNVLLVGCMAAVVSLVACSPKKAADSVKAPTASAFEALAKTAEFTCADAGDCKVLSESIPAKWTRSAPTEDGSYEITVSFGTVSPSANLAEGIKLSGGKATAMVQGGAMAESTTSENVEGVEINIGCTDACSGAAAFIAIGDRRAAVSVDFGAGQAEPAANKTAQPMTLPEAEAE